VFLWLCIAVRVIANPCSNALQKYLAACGLATPTLLAVTHTGLAILMAPWLIARGTSVSAAFWGWSLGSAALAVAANWLIIEAVQRSDLSVLGPINSYKPVVSLLPAVVFLGERPGALTLAGIGLVVAGSLLLVDSTANRRRGFLALIQERGVQFRFTALVLSAGEAVALKRALRLADPTLTFAAWAVLGLALVLPLALRPLLRNFRDLPHASRRSNAALLTGLILTTGLMQFCTLVTLQQMPVGMALALFQISTLVSVVLGYAVFREAHFRRRLLGAGVMAGGAVVLILS